ncbi:hypothetical protein OG339_47960 (plasmid) [Streptosporangium sp. NBC_01495]|uniref:hypothetical protein n=1 Tax=Streptosporangium sp. NBC_01495 TaxID=2903899 RepID=UPI002E3658D2|nr:hypothetical protein [Streptosporangium sp. NBC_01495]
MSDSESYEEYVKRLQEELSAAVQDDDEEKVIAILRNVLSRDRNLGISLAYKVIEDSINKML